jgi:tetratricopeptide (TPR) repeat protein
MYGYTGPVGRVVFLCAFALLVAFAAPGVYLGDAGELTTAAFTLGVAHETGFSLYCLLAKAAALLPFGEVATRVSFFSSLAGAFAAWLVYRGVRELAGKDLVAKLAGVGAAAILLGGLTFWKSATTVEVYAPTAAAIALALWLLELAARGVASAGLALALVGGLSLGLHAQLRILLGPACAVFALLQLRKGARWPLLAPLAVALGASVIAYLPLRAAQHPAANWSDPRRLDGVVRHLSAHRIRAAFGEQMFSTDLGLVWERLRHFFSLIEGQLGAVILLGALGGLVWLIARARTAGIVLFVVLAGDALYTAWINPMGTGDLQNGAPTCVALALCAGAGLAAAARRFPKAGQPFAAAALGVIALVPAWISDGEAKFHLGFEADGWSRAALDDAPVRGVIFATTDDLIASTFYQRVVAGARPDVIVYARQQTARSLVERYLQERPVSWEPGGDSPPTGVLEPGLPVERLVLSPQPLPPPIPIYERLAERLGSARDPSARRLLSGGLTGLGRVYFLRGDETQARLLFEAALKLRPNDAVAATDLAVLRAREGDFGGALRLCEEVLARDPTRQVARLNAARYRLALSDLDGAERDFREHARRAPRDAAPLVGLSRVAARRGDKAGAERFLQEALARDPRHPEALSLKKDLR